jgi:hypothetical protein
MLHVLPLSAAADGVFTISDRTEARVRAPDPITNAVALDLDTLVDARAVWTPHNATYTLADLPRFTLLDFNGAAIQPALLDGIIAAAEWRLPRVRIRVAETASYGQLSFESLSAIAAPGTPEPTPSPTGQPPPLATATLVPKTSQSILYGASETSVGSTLLLRPWTVQSRVGYQLTGGVDSAAQQYLPFQEGPFAEATADYELDAHDHAATVVTGSETSFSAPANTEDVLAEIEEQWRHRWARMTETSLGAGWYVARTRAGLDQPDVFASNPVAEAAFDQRYKRGVNLAELRLDVRLAPFINRLTGLVDEQIRAIVEGSWTHRRFKLRAFASGAESVDQGTATSTRYGTAELDAAYKVSEWLTFDGGVRALYQEQNGPALAGSTSPFVESTLSQGVVFLAVTVRALKARF